MIGIILILVAVVFLWVDRRYGLSYLSAGFGASLGFIGVGLLLGFEISNIEPFAILFTMLIFTPIMVRLFFVREVKRSKIASGISETDAVHRNDRHSDIVLENAPRIASSLKMFAFFLVQGAFLLFVGTGLFGSSDLSGVHIAGIPVAASHQISAIASRYTASKTWQIVWGAVGLFLVGPLILFLIVVHRLDWRLSWLIGS